MKQNNMAKSLVLLYMRDKIQRSMVHMYKLLYMLYV